MKKNNKNEFFFFKTTEASLYFFLNINKLLIFERIPVYNAENLTT